MADLCYSVGMKRASSIGKEWAKSILNNGYQTDSKDPYTTYAKVWNNKTNEWETVKFELGKVKKRKIRFNDCYGLVRD